MRDVQRETTIDLFVRDPFGFDEELEALAETSERLARIRVGERRDDRVAEDLSGEES